jgi:N6-adenosine-specific RNA methylase IME4
MTVDSIRALRIPAAPDCALFLWATQPMLPLDVMTAWGFAYRSHWVWEKDRIGTGYWSRNLHELLLIGTRGDVPAPLPGTQIESIIPAPRGAHSAKPEVFARYIEQLFPGLPKLEMFARSPRAGWHVWGNEADSEAQSGVVKTARSPTGSAKRHCAHTVGRLRSMRSTPRGRR